MITEVREDDTTDFETEVSDEIKVRVAEAETKMIWRSKVLLLFIILLTASGSALAVFRHTKKLEEEHFHYMYEKAVIELIKVSQFKANDLLGWARSVSLSITSNTLVLNQSWPKVTVPYFDRLGSYTIEASSVHYAAICPLVTEDQRQEWEEWSAQNAAEWIDNGAQNRTFTSSFISPEIFANFSVCTPEKLLIADIDDDGTLNLSEYKDFLQDLGGDTCDISTAFNDGVLLPKNWNVLKCLCPNEADIYSSYSSECCDENDFQLSTNNETLHRVCRVLDRSIYEECKVFPASKSVKWVQDKKLPFDYQRQDFNPVWQIQPVIPEIVNLDLLSTNIYSKLTPEVRKTRLPALSEPTLDSLDPASPLETPITYVAVPIIDSFESDSVAAILSTVIPWHTIFADLLPVGTMGIFAVLRSTCSKQQHATYTIDGPEFVFRGMGDIHDPTYDHMKLSATFFEDLSSNSTSSSAESSSCSYSVDFYPLAQCSIVQNFITNLPLFNAFVVFMIFLVTSLLFLFYDYLVKRRQTKVMKKVEQSNAIVNSVFPEHVRDRLLENTCQELKMNQSGRFPSDEMQTEKSQPVASKPIADLFPHATVMIADICDFSVWSSMRDASQVFTLLEHIYSAFDKLAKRRRVFKVETNSDCYVGVSGLPVPRSDHAVVMAKFAHKCRIEMNLVVRSLGIQLGPDTCDLTMRFGLHSGPITAGVLRGEKSRFQLFGDTVNTAYRISSSCERNMIQVSQETANLLIAANKEAWVSPRESLVDSKGKGPIQTYWLTVKERERSDDATHVSMSVSSASGDTAGLENGVIPNEDDKTKRLIGYMADVLQNQLKKIVAMRQEKSLSGASVNHLQVNTREGETVLDEVMEVIPMLVEAKAPTTDPEIVQLPAAVNSQIQDYVRSVAAIYRNNSFHNFEHAGHVTQSLVKLLSRIVTKDSIDYENMAFKKKSDVQLHEFTYGITSDPIIDFACVFSALIHDADHPGIPNGQMIEEGDSRAERYNNKSIAEQNSVDLAWNLLMEPSYSEFRACIYETQDELDRFRRLVVNSVMATDIADKELSALRKNRWKKAFDASASEVTTQEDINRKATIVIEHLIQAADVSHTMQHWNVYLKWNERLFHELYGSYLEGRGTDPSGMWYKGELGFFDYYLIPLTKKLRECGVFGVTSDEYLNYAQANRREWEHKGESIVAGYLAQYNEKQSEEEEQCINPPTSICDGQSIKKCGVSAATA